ncbi:MAG: HEAT repeat domain-containing protein [Candidatus Bilamarchaeaceae archaeon]
MAETRDLNKLISLTFDENPAVRMKAAEILGKYDDPAAVFALMELNYDKDPAVRKKAQEIISSKKESGGEELLSFAELFSQGKKSDKEEPMSLDKKEKILSPISKMFEKHLGKEKAELVKKKMMPTIEKIYHRSIGGKKQEPEEQGRKVIQEFLTSYLEALSDIDEIKPNQPKTTASIVAEAEEVKVAVKDENAEQKEEELAEVGKEVIEDKLVEDLQRIENDEIIEIEEEKEIEKLPDTFFKKAYEVMMLSGGDEEIMHREMERMLKNAEKDITLAFKLAKRKFKEKKITNITKIRDGMRNINTDPLLVKEVENIEYIKNKRTKEMGLATRIVVNDEEGNEGVIFLYDGRGKFVAPGMKLKVIRGQAKLFESSGETVITIGKKGEVYIVL